MLIKFEVGDRFPLEKIVEHFKCADGGASLNYNNDDKQLSLYVALPNPSRLEVNAFTKD